MEEAMKRKFLSALGIVALLSGFLVAAPVVASEPTPPAGLIAVDMDPYFKSLAGDAAATKIQADTAAAAAELAAAVEAYGTVPSTESTKTKAKGRKATDTSTTSTVTAAGVGDVCMLYADGWREFTLRAIGGNAEIWVANDLSYCPGDPRPPHVVTQEQVDYLFNEFNNNIYQSDTTYFGYTKDRDGSGGLFASSGYDWYKTDNPQRVMILVYNIVDEGYCDPTYPFYVAGYFWAAMNDVYADRNVIHIDSYDWANRIGPDVARPFLYEGTIAHEYEHAIHYDHDADEPSWVDEGMADLSGFLAGYGHSRSHLAYYMVYHRTPLTVWGGGLEDYGESYLFQLYLMEHFGGPDFITALVDEQANGIAGIENQLAAFGYGASFDDIYRDWTLANYLDDPSLAGRSAPLGYDTLDIPSVDTQGYSIQWSVANYYGSDNAGNLPIPRYYGGYKSGTVQYPLGDVPPYAPMYLTYKGMEPQLISNFRADNASGIAAHSGSYQLWGGRGDLLFNTATLAAPVTLGPGATLSFWAWFEIEPLWDFAFVQVSTDGGSTWTSLANADTTEEYDPSAHPDVIANVPGFTGSSGGWVQETFDLSGYTGDALIRFLYVTDWATNEAGFYADDIVISDSNGTLLSDDLEGGSGNWALGGFLHTTGLAANDWELSFVNPIYESGNFSQYQIQDDQMYVDDNYQRDLTVLDTLNLNSEAVTIVLSNHLPEDTSFPGSYRLLVEKGDASG
jgi:immune inhibitor A